MASSPPLCPSCNQPATVALAGPEHGWECRNEACPEFGQPVREHEPRRAEARGDLGPAPRARLALVEFPADDPQRARRFWEGLLDEDLAERAEHQGSGHQTQGDDPAVGVHERGAGPGDTHALPYFAVGDLEAALARVRELGGSIIHPGQRWAICRDSEGTPFALAAGR